MVSEFIAVYLFKRFLFVPDLFSLGKNTPLDLEDVFFLIFLCLSRFSLLMSQCLPDDCCLLIVLPSQYDSLSIDIFCSQTSGHWLFFGNLGDFSSVSIGFDLSNNLIKEFPLL